MTSDLIGLYCSRVCAHVRFRPDHPAITAELSAHLRDHAESLYDRYSVRAAEEKAVAAMGDPAELGRWLDRVHSPLLGWFQIWFRRVVWTIAALVLLVFLSQAGRLAADLAAPPPAGMLERILDSDAIQLLYDGSPDVRWDGGDYTFTVPRAVFASYMPEGGGEPYRSLYCTLKITHKNPWLREPDFQGWLYAKDDLGNRYPARNDPGARLNDRESGGNPTGVHPFASYYEWWVGGIDPDARSVTLIFDHYGAAEVYLTIPLGEEVPHG